MVDGAEEMEGCFLELEEMDADEDGLPSLGPGLIFPESTPSEETTDLLPMLLLLLVVLAFLSRDPKSFLEDLLLLLLFLSCFEDDEDACLDER